MRSFVRRGGAARVPLLLLGSVALSVGLIALAASSLGVPA